MRVQYIHLGRNPAIPVTVVRHESKLLVECRDASALMARFASTTLPAPLGPDVRLRAVVGPGNAAVLQLFDALGAASDEIQLTPVEATQLAQELW